jgi:hypothetical protein
MREFVHRSALVASLRLKVHPPRVSLVPLLAADWNPDLHPRGHDGKFIDVLGLIDLIDMPGFRHGQRGSKKVQGQVAEIIPDPDKPGDPIIRVKMTDSRWDAKAFGGTFDARSYQVSSRDAPKATISWEKELLPEGEAPAIVPPAPISAPAHTPASTEIGEILPPMVKTPDWDLFSPETKHAWMTAQMEADLAAFRGAPTIWKLDGTDPEVGFNLANRYRELIGVDPATALWVDAVVTNKTAPSVGDEFVKGTSAIAVAYPGTKHPGGIGPVTNRKAIVLNEKHFMDDKTWAKEKAMSGGGSFPWSVGSEQGDYTATLVHEFGHHRQFRYLASTMLEAGQPFSKVRQSDGFGLMPDSSNWPEVQAARYSIQKLAPSQYGRSKSSEAFAEVWSAVTTGYVPVEPDLQMAWDTWHAGMEVPGQMPQDRFTPDELVDYESLTPVEQADYWAQASALLEIPGMREHYPDTASLFDVWVAEQFPEAAMMPSPGEWETLDSDGKVLRFQEGENRYLIMEYQGLWRLYRNGQRMEAGSFEDLESYVDQQRGKSKLVLYRGEGSHDHPSYYTGSDSGMAGGWWTTDIEAARRYMKSVPDGKLYEIEVDESEAEVRGLHYFITDPEIRARRQAVPMNVAPREQTARLRMRPKIYGDKEGFVIQGTDTFGRRVSVFVPGSREEAEQAKKRIQAGEPAFGAI